MSEFIGVLLTIATYTGYLICGVLGYLMFQRQPPRMPWIAAVLMIIGGMAVVPAFQWILGKLTAILPATIATLLSLAVLLATVVLVYTVINDMIPKLGRRVAGGKVDFSTGVRGFALPSFVAVGTGTVVTWISQFLDNSGGAVATWADRGF